MRPQTRSLNSAAFPRQVGRYRLLLPLGTGGMATVYLARTTGVGGFQRDVALKLIHAHLRADEESKLQLLDEARLAARIRHPNVVPVLEVGEDASGVFLVMEYVEGDTLSGLVRNAKKQGRDLSRAMLGRIMCDALLGLHAAHGLTGPDGTPLGLVHRDFSPQNILVSVEGMTRLSDFGVAKARDRAVRTKTGLTKGKISYMAPEQARGRAIDRRSDVWAAGVVLWELLAERRMNNGDDDVATLLSLVTEPRPRLSSVAEVPEQVDEVVARALAPEAADRYASADEFRLAIEDAFNQSGIGIARREALAAEVRKVTRDMLAERERQAATAESATITPPPPPPKPLAWQESKPRPKGPSEPAEPVTQTATPLTQAAAKAAAGSDPNDATLRIPTLAERHSADPRHAATRADRVRVGGDEEMTQTSAVIPAVPARRTAIWGWVGGGIAATALGLTLLATLSEPNTGTAARTAAEDSTSITPPAGSTASNTARSGGGTLPPEAPSMQAATAPTTSSGAPGDPTAGPLPEAKPPTEEPAQSEGSASSDKPKIRKTTRSVPPRLRPSPGIKAPQPRQNKPGLASNPYDTQKSSP